MKIFYKQDGIFVNTECHYRNDCKVNSFNCHHCKFFRSTNYKEKYVVCMADCSSHLKEILDKIDIVIANDKFDDICFEDFLAEVREDIASILDDSHNI